MKYMVGDISGLNRLQADSLKKGMDGNVEPSHEGPDLIFPLSPIGICGRTFEACEKWDEEIASNQETSYLRNVDPLVPMRLLQVAVSYNDQLLYDRAITGLSSAIKKFYPRGIPLKILLWSKGQ